jgi:hypothetical protein
MLRRAFARFVLAATVALPFAGCGGDSGTGPRGSVVGTWNLQTINAQPLPVVVDQQGADRLEITRDSFTFSTSTFSQTTDFRLTQGGQVTTGSVDDTGRYTVDGNALTVTFDSDGSSVTGALAANTITITDDGLVAVYRRQ